MFSSETRKDSLAFIEGTGEFVCYFTTYDLREQVNQTSAPLARGVNEMARAGLEAAPSRLVRPPRVAASPCALECLWLKTVSLDDCDGRPVDRHVVFGRWSASISTTASSRTASSTPARCGRFSAPAITTIIPRCRKRGFRCDARRAAAAAAAEDMSANLRFKSRDRAASLLPPPQEGVWGGGSFSESHAVEQHLPGCAAMTTMPPGLGDRRPAVAVRSRCEFRRVVNGNFRIDSRHPRAPCEFGPE
jgi:hypothetical protein